MSKPIAKTKLLSVRLTSDERDALEARAGGQTLSTYVKQTLFNGPVAIPRGSGITVANRTLLAHLLATLGGSRIAPNLERLAEEAKLGNLFCDEETTGRLIEACDDVRLMHNALMRGLGVGGERAHQEARVSWLFNLLNSGGKNAQ